MIFGDDQSMATVVHRNTHSRRHLDLPPLRVHGVPCPLPSLLSNDRNPHIRPKHLRHRHAAIRVLILLENGNQDARAGDRGVVQRVAESGLALSSGSFVAIAQVEPPRLKVAERASAVRLAVTVPAGHPGFDVVHAPLALSHVAGAIHGHAVRKLQRLQDRPRRSR